MAKKNTPNREIKKCSPNKIVNIGTRKAGRYNDKTEKGWVGPCSTTTKPSQPAYAGPVQLEIYPSRIGIHIFSRKTSLIHQTKFVIFKLKRSLNGNWKNFARGLKLPGVLDLIPHLKVWRHFFEVVPLKSIGFPTVFSYFFITLACMQNCY